MNSRPSPITAIQKLNKACADLESNQGLHTLEAFRDMCIEAKDVIFDSATPSLPRGEFEAWKHGDDYTESGLPKELEVPAKSCIFAIKKGLEIARRSADLPFRFAEVGLSKNFKQQLRSYYISECAICQSAIEILLSEGIDNAMRENSVRTIKLYGNSMGHSARRL